MPIAEARIPTNRASRYLVQLCRHANQMRRMRRQPPARRTAAPMRPQVDHVDYSDTVGTVRFADGQVTMEASPDAVALRIEAADDDSLRRIQDGIAPRLQTIGRRDQLTATWHRLEAPIPPDNAAHATDPATVPSAGKRWRRRLTVAAMVIGGALIVALHLGFGGAALAADPWTGPVINTALVMILATLVFVAAHLIMGRVAVRGAKAVHTHWKSRDTATHEERS